MLNRISVLLLAMLLAFPMAGFAQEPVPEEFAHGMSLVIPADGSIYELTMPLDVYKGVTKPDLSDICVFNAQKEMVPFATAGPAPEDIAPPEFFHLPIFPVMGAPGQSVGGVSLEVKRDESGSIINVATTDRHEPEGKVVVAYLLDASRLNDVVTALELDTGPMPEGEIAKVSVEYSYDLKGWNRMVTGATIADLRFGDNSLSVRRIELGGMSAKYYRLVNDGPGTMLTVNGVSAALAPRTVARPRNWLSVESAESAEKPGEYLFETSGRMPVDRLRVHLPQQNTILKAEFFSRASAESAWRKRGDAVVYGLRVDGGYMQNPDIELGSSSDREYMMRVGPDKGGIGKGVPRIEVGWVPHRLFFAARGAAPFMVAYGSGRAFPNDGRADYLLAKVSEMRNTNVPVMTALPGEVTTLGGESALLPEKPPFNLKKLVLWAILISGVLFLAWMSLSLYRRMSSGGGEPE